MREGGPVDADPEDDQTYTGDTIFGDGDEIGSGNFVVKIGSGPVTITGLSASTTYYVSIYEFNDVGGEKYLVPGASDSDTTIAAFDPDAQAFFDVTSLTADEKTAYNTLVLSLKAATSFLGGTFYSRHQAAWPMLGSSEANCKFNSIDPRDLDAAFRLVYSAGGWAFGPKGAYPNGVDGYARTFMNPSTSLSNTLGGLSYYTRTEGAATMYDIGCAENSGLTTKALFLVCRYAGDISYFGWGNGGYATTFSNAVGRSSFHGVYSGGVAKIYQGATQKATNTEASAMPNSEIYLGAINGGGTAKNFSNRECSWAAIHTLAPEDIAAYDAILETFQRALNRSYLFNKESALMRTQAAGDYSDIATWEMQGVDSTYYDSPYKPLVGNAVTIAHAVSLSQNERRKSQSITTGSITLNGFTLTGPTAFPAYTNLPSSTYHDDYVTALNDLIQGIAPGGVTQSTFGSISGATKYAGGVLFGNFIYCIPSSANNVGKINWTNDSFSTFGTPGASSQDWLEGALCPINGKIYCAPYGAGGFDGTTILVIDTSNDTFYWVDTTGVKGSNSGDLIGTGKYSAVNFGADGRMYFTPYQANTVMILDPADDSLTFIDTAGLTTYGNGNLGTNHKWDGGINWKQYVYGSPSDALDVLKIDTLNGTCSRFGTIASGTAKYSSIAMAANEIIYMFPYGATDVLRLDPSDDSITYIDNGALPLDDGYLGNGLMADGTMIPIPQNRNMRMDQSVEENDRQFAFSGTAGGGFPYLGGIVAPNGALYGVPNQATTVLKIVLNNFSDTLDTNFVMSSYVNKY